MVKESSSYELVNEEEQSPSYDHYMKNENIGIVDHSSQDKTNDENSLLGQNLSQPYNISSVSSYSNQSQGKLFQKYVSRNKEVMSRAECLMTVAENKQGSSLKRADSSNLR